MWTSLWLGLALAAEPSMADLQEGQALAWQVVGHCRARPASCSAPARKTQLARAFYTLVVDDLVQGRPVDPVAVANVRYLSEDLWRRLPDVARTPAPTPAEWVVAMSEPPPKPMPTASPAPAPAEEPAPAPPVDVDTLAPLQRVAALWPTRDQQGIGPKLQQSLEAAGMPAAALTVVLDSPDPTWPMHERATSAVALSGALGTHRLLLDWITAHPPEQWPEDERPIGLLLSGISHQERGQYSPALKAYAAIDPSQPGWLQAQFHRGMIAWQTGDLWGALRAFRNAAEAEQHLPDDAHVREQAVWRAADLYNELGRTSDAIATWEVLTIHQGPLAQRAALKCAWATHHLGDTDESSRWMPSWPARGLYRPERDLLEVQRLLANKDRAGARATLERARADIASLDADLSDLLDDLGDLWTRLEQSDDAVLRDRLGANPTVSAWQSTHQTVQVERQLPDALRTTRAGRELDQRLNALSAHIRTQTTTAAYYEMSGLRRELEQLDRAAERQQRAIRGH